MRQLKYDRNAMMRRLEPPQLIAGLLVAVLGLQLAWIVTGQLGAHDPTVIAPVSAPTAPGQSTQGPSTPGPSTSGVLEQIRDAHFFGRASGSEPGSAAPTSLNLQLAGVLAERDPAKGQAILAETGGAARVYAVGATLPGGARLAAVYPDRILIERGGITESLALPQRALGSLAPVGAAAASPMGSASPMASTEDLSALLRWQVVVRPGRSAGVRVYPGNDPRVFAQLGLRSGDLVLAINDVPLADPANAEQFLRTLTGSPESVLTLERDGREERLSVSVSGVLAPPLT